MLILFFVGLLFFSPINANAGEGAQREYLQLGPGFSDQIFSGKESRSKENASIPYQDALLYNQRGERLLRMEPRIIGGTPAPDQGFPWQVSIGISGMPFDQGHFCGGSLIDINWVLTAAHCITKSPELMQIKYGSNYLSQGGKVLQVKEILVHEGWNPKTFENDIALIRLKDSASGTPIEPISDKEVDLFSPGVIGIATGWGLTSEGGKISNTLQEVGLIVQSNPICNSPASYGGQIKDGMFCAGFVAGGKDSCQGDSGGPLVVSNKKGGFLLAGIVSWGDGCAQRNKYGIYTRVSHYYTWIKEKMKKI